MIFDNYDKFSRGDMFFYNHIDHNGKTRKLIVILGGYSDICEAFNVYPAEEQTGTPIFFHGLIEPTALKNMEKVEQAQRLDCESSPVKCDILNQTDLFNNDN